MALRASQLKIGDTHIERVAENLSRTQIVMYCGVSGDYNPLHADEVYVTQKAGYPSVFAHGMLTMGLTGKMLTNYVGPWGISYSANISSDSTGIGNWSEKQFFKAIREGKYLGLDNTRPLLPPMPWQEYRHASDDDLRAIFAFLKSTKPVKNVVPQAMIRH